MRPQTEMAPLAVHTRRPLPGRDTRHLFYHNLNGKKLVCIPMGVRKGIQDASFASWVYPFDAVHGGSMRF